MPSFDKLKFTTNGLAMQASAQAGNQLTFSKIKIGKGNTAGDVSSLSNLITPVLEANIITGSLANNVYTVQANITNAGLSDGFYWKEIGLFAIDNEDNEVLYSYSCTNEETDYIPSASESSYMKRVKIAIVVGEATNIQIVTTDDTYIDAITFNEKVEEIKETLSDINFQLNSFATSDELDLNINEINSQLLEVDIALTELSNQVSERLDQINVLHGTTSIADIGDGTVTGAIAELYRLISEIPAITSGTAEPSGGEDGDVYVMYEE